MGCFTRQHIFNQGVNCSKPRFLRKPWNATFNRRDVHVTAITQRGPGWEEPGANLWRQMKSPDEIKTFCPVWKCDKRMAARRLRLEMATTQGRVDGWGPVVWGALKDDSFAANKTKQQQKKLEQKTQPSKTPKTNKKRRFHEDISTWVLMLRTQLWDSGVSSRVTRSKRVCRHF